MNQHRKCGGQFKLAKLYPDLRQRGPLFAYQYNAESNYKIAPKLEVGNLNSIKALTVGIPWISTPITDPLLNHRLQSAMQTSTLTPATCTAYMFVLLETTC